MPDQVARDSTGQKPIATHVGKCKKRSIKLMQCRTLADQQNLLVPIDTSATDLGAYAATANRRVKARHAQHDHEIRNEMLFREYWAENRKGLVATTRDDAQARMGATLDRVRRRSRA